MVDDSALIRRLVTGVLAEDPDIEVVGTAANGRDAVAGVAELRPDAVTLDIEMPVLDGLGALREIRRLAPRLPVIMFSTLTERGAAATLEALSLGASDYVTKPSNTGSLAEGRASIRDQLVPRVKALAGVRRLAIAPVRPAARRRTEAVDAVVIGCSTGGPDALSTVLAALPRLPVPIAVVQHMPPVFTAMFAQRLDRDSPHEVVEATDGDAFLPGRVLLAPGDHHLRLEPSARGGVRARLDQGPQVNFCRPAVDVLFRSAADLYGGRVLAVVLTGMGQDGLQGCRALRDRGAGVLVQDEATSVVWGMPGAVAAAGLADEIVPLEALTDHISAAVSLVAPVR